MKHIKARIEEMLSTICERVFLESAEDDSLFPYLVYFLENGTNYYGMMVYTLDIDVWDKAETTINIDELSSKLKKLDKVTYIDDNIQFTLYFDRLINAQSKHEDLKRYTLMFNVRAIERS